MNSFELNKVLGAILGTCLILLALNIGAGAIFRAGKAGQARLCDRRQDRRRSAGRGGKTAGAADRDAARLGLGGKGRDRRQAVPGLPHLDKGGPNRVGPNLWNIVGDARGKGRGGFNFPPP